MNTARIVGASDQTSEIIKIRRPGGVPPYLVHKMTSMRQVFPGMNASIEHPQNRESTEGDRLAPFGFTGWGGDPLARHRWNI